MNKYKVGSFELLKYIHYKTFNHLYEFAGKIRTVDISKDNFQFAPIRYIDIAIESVEKMPIDTFDNIIDKYTEMNIIHPFREGNGRTMRLWLNNMLENKIGLIIDWSLINKSDYFNAMIKSHIDTNELKVLLHSALTNKIDDESIFFKGLDNSYNYEEMEEYKSHEL